jgi:hypothetical protein
VPAKLRYYDKDEYLFVCTFAVVSGLLTLKPQKADVFLSRDQSEEWKGE